MPRKLFMVGADMPVTGPLSVATVMVVGIWAGSVATALATHSAAAARNSERTNRVGDGFIVCLQSIGNSIALNMPSGEPSVAQRRREVRHRSRALRAGSFVRSAGRPYVARVHLGPR